MQKQKKSKLIVIGIVVLLVGYAINQFIKSNVQKDQIIKHDIMIGVCAKNKASVEANNYEKLKTHEDIKLELQTNELFNKLFKECEKEFKKAPKDFRAKWNYKAKWDSN